EAQQTHHTVNQQKHDVLGVGNDLVGRRLNTRVTRSQQEGMFVIAVRLGKHFYPVNNRLQSLGLVILQEHQNRSQVATGIDQARRRITNGGIDDGLVTGNLEPLPTAFVQ